MNGIRLGKSIPSSYYDFIYNNSVDDEQALYDLRIWSNEACVDMFNEE